MFKNNNYKKCHIVQSFVICSVSKSGMYDALIDFVLDDSGSEIEQVIVFVNEEKLFYFLILENLC